MTAPSRKSPDRLRWHHWRRWSSALVLVALSGLALVLAARAAGPAQARLFLPTGTAAWIWTPLPRAFTLPIAFYAARDFTLDAAPAAARLEVAADEEYVLYLNGKRVGSGGCPPGCVPGGTRLDLYDVTPLLRAGGNRLLAELRSSRGAGGFLARLEEPESGRAILVTDRRWRVFARRRRGLFSGLTALGPGVDDGGEPAAVWGVPPVGRWGIPAPGRELPLFALTAGGGVPPVTGRILGPRAVFDWGQEVEGYLALTLAPDARPAGGTPLDRPRMGLFAVDGGAETAPVLVVPGEAEWVDIRPRRFRRVQVVGLAGLRQARVLPAAGALLPEKPAAPPPGVLGVVPPRLRTPVEDEVRRELQGVAGVAGREDL